MRQLDPSRGVSSILATRQTTNCESVTCRGLLPVLRGSSRPPRRGVAARESREFHGTRRAVRIRPWSADFAPP